MPWPWVRRHADGIGLAVFVACFTYASLILGELVPKRISLHRAEGLAIFVAPIMQFIAAVARPLVWFMGASTNAVLWLLRLGTSREPSVSLDDIEHLIDTGTAEGVVEPLEQRAGARCAAAGRAHGARHHAAAHRPGRDGRRHAARGSAGHRGDGRLFAAAGVRRRSRPRDRLRAHQGPVSAAVSRLADRAAQAAAPGPVRARDR